MSLDTQSTHPHLPPTDVHTRLLNASCLDFLLIELVPMAERLAHEPGARGLELGASDDGGEEEQGEDGEGEGKGEGEGDKTQTQTQTNGTAPPDDNEEARREATFFRLEGLGYRVGQGLAERFSRNRPRFTEHLDVIKFLCKDLWVILFRKQIDNLKTNHRGVYVLTDSSFRPFARMSTSVRGEAVTMAQSYLWFPCGVVRGALANLGINATVQAETSELPTATFQIKSSQPKS
ncbi:Bet3 family [Aspergillus sp. HF37]|nr:Bet3 family [Aspergillus sp. HF37]